MRARRWMTWSIGTLMALGVGCGGVVEAETEGTSRDTSLPLVGRDVTPGRSEAKASELQASQVRVGWARRLGGAGDERLLALSTDARGGFVTAGQFGDTPFSSLDGFALARYDVTGALQWSRTVTTEQAEAHALAVTPEGNLLVVGTYTGAPDLGTGPLPRAPSTYSALFLAKYSPSGQPLWTRGFDTRGPSPAVFPLAVATDAQGSLVVVGQLRGRVNLGGGDISAGVVNENDPNNLSPGGFVAKFTWQGQHVFSRAIDGGSGGVTTDTQTVSTDSAGNVLVGGRAGRGANLGDGVLTQDAPYVARYSPTGTLQWKRLFPGARGTIASVAPVGTTAVAFNANLGGRFTFGGAQRVGGSPGDAAVDDLGAFTATLSGTGTDGWLRDQGQGRVRQLVADTTGTLTVLGDNTTGASESMGTPYVARYSASGAPLGSRALDPNLFSDGLSPERMRMGLQPGGSVVVGSAFMTPISLDGRTYTSRGRSDLFFFQLLP